MNSLWASRRVGATAASVPLAALAIAACGGGSDTPSATEGRERSAKILTAAYHVLDRGVPYHELGEEFFYRRDTENAERYRRRLVRQLESLGHQFTLQPLPEAA